MKTKLAQLVAFISRIDRHHIQFAGLLVMLVAGIVTQSPSDGSIGPS